MEDLCEIGGLESDKNANDFTDDDKKKMLKRLSRLPQTEKFLRNEQALSNFVDSQYRTIGGPQQTLTLDGIYRTGSMLSMNRHWVKTSLLY